MEEKFDYDTDIDEEREVKRKKLAKKEIFSMQQRFHALVNPMKTCPNETEP